MPTDTAIDPADHLKYLRHQGRATLERVFETIAGSADLTEHVSDEVCGALDVVNDLIDSITVDGNPNRYSDGRAVFTELELDHGVTMRHTWHPDPVAPCNQPQVIRGYVRLAGGRCKRIIIAAPGVLDAIDTVPLADDDAQDHE
jgi:hypothetical protein